LGFHLHKFELINTIPDDWQGVIYQFVYDNKVTLMKKKKKKKKEEEEEEEEKEEEVKKELTK